MVLFSTIYLNVSTLKDIIWEVFQNMAYISDLFPSSKNNKKKTFLLIFYDQVSKYYLPSKTLAIVHLIFQRTHLEWILSTKKLIAICFSFILGGVPKLFLYSKSSNNQLSYRRISSTRPLTIFHVYIIQNLLFRRSHINSNVNCIIVDFLTLAGPK